MLSQVRVSQPFTGPPAVVEADDPVSWNLDGFQAWLADEGAELDRLVDQAGAVLLRGFPLSETADFATVMSRYSPHADRYWAGVSPRNHISGPVFEATHAPAAFKIPLHQEKAYLPRYPRMLAFYCRRAPESGGETILADMRQFTETIPDALRQKVESRGILYTRNFSAPDADPRRERSALLKSYHRSWSEAFYTRDREEVTKICQNLSVEFSWQDNDSLSLTYRGSGFVKSPQCNQNIWFNQIATLHPNEYSLGLAYGFYKKYIEIQPHPPYEVSWGDGCDMTVEEIRPIYDIMEGLTIASPWREGDLLIINNILVSHGRNPFRGHRDVQVIMVD